MAKKLKSKTTLKDVVDKLPDNSDVPIKKTICFAVELYPDDTNYNCDDVLKFFVNWSELHGHTYAYILHDEDYYLKTTFDNNYRVLGRKGDLKKPHYHFVCAMANQVPIDIGDVLIKIPELPKRFVKCVPASKIDAMFLYLSHIKYPEKTFYPLDKHVTNNKDYLQGLHENYHPESAVNFVLHYLIGQNCSITYAHMWHVALDVYHIPYDDYKRNYNIIKDLIIEHNLEFRQENLNIMRNEDISIKANQQKEAELKKMCSLADCFGTTYIELNGKKYLLVSPSNDVPNK